MEDLYVLAIVAVIALVAIVAIIFGREFHVKARKGDREGAVYISGNSGNQTEDLIWMV